MLTFLAASALWINRTGPIFDDRYSGELQSAGQGDVISLRPPLDVQSERDLIPWQEYYEKVKKDSHTVQPPNAPAIASPLFAKAYLALLDDNPKGFDPLTLTNDFFAKQVAGMPSGAATILEQFDKLIALRHQPPITDNVVWPNHINPFYWLNRLTRQSALQASIDPLALTSDLNDWWSVNGPASSKGIIDLLPVWMNHLSQLELKAAGPQMASATLQNDKAVNDFINRGSAKTEEDFKKAASTFQYSTPYYNWALIYASAKDWNAAKYYFNEFRTVRKKEAQRYRTETDSLWDKRVSFWLSQIDNIAAVTAADNQNHFQSNLYMDDVNASIVLSLLGQRRAAIALAARANQRYIVDDAQEFKQFDRCYAYYAAAFAVASSPLKSPDREDLVLSILGLAQPHAFGDDADNASALYAKLNHLYKG